MNEPHLPEPGYAALTEDLLDRAQRAEEHWCTPGAERLGMAPDALAALRQAQHDDTAGLKRIVERLGQWPGRRTVGPEACQAAVDIAVRSDHNPALQRTLLGLLQKAAEVGDAISAQLAHLHDRCLVNAGPGVGHPALVPPSSAPAGPARACRRTPGRPAVCASGTGRSPPYPLPPGTSPPPCPNSKRHDRHHRPPVPVQRPSIRSGR